jgi:uracil-DNA glycosylase family 4
MMESSDREALTAWLAWQVAMGADAAVDEATIDWLSRGPAVPGEGLVFETPRATGGAPGGLAATKPPAARGALPAAASATSSASAPPPPAPIVLQPRPAPPVQPPRAVPPAAPAIRQFPTAAPDAAEANARRLARGAASLAELESLLKGFDGCALKATAKNLCFFRGAAHAPVMLIGEAPGREEDLEGKPFVGRAGQLLDKMLKAAALGETQCHITNVVYWRPPGNRTPTPQEVQVCRPFLERQVELVAPRIIVPLGGAAAKAVLDVAEGITKIRGKWRDVTIGGHACKALATLHPAFLLRTPSAKRQAWRDLLAVTDALEA